MIVEKEKNEIKKKKIFLLRDLALFLIIYEFPYNGLYISDIKENFD